MATRQLGPRIGHIGIVVADIEEAVRTYAELLGMDAPEVRLSVPASPRTYRGQVQAQGTSVKVARFYLENIELELLEPVGGPSVWREVLEAAGPSVHHLGFVVPDAAATLAELEGRGYETIHRGTRPNGKPMGYADARGELGVLFEVMGGDT